LSLNRFRTGEELSEGSKQGKGWRLTWRCKGGKKVEDAGKKEGKGPAGTVEVENIPHTARPKKIMKEGHGAPWAREDQSGRGSKNIAFLCCAYVL